MTSFADIDPQDIKLDCRFYSGYKPCHRHDGCPGCPVYEPRGTEILIVKLGAMGDVLRTKSLLPGLKALHPQSWITWITAPGSEPIVRDPRVSEIRTFTPAGLAALEGRRFDLMLCLDKDAHAVALARGVDATRKLGFAPTPFNTITVWNEASAYALRLGLSDDLKYRINRKTVPEILYEMAELPYGGQAYELTLSQEARDRAGERLAGVGLPQGRPIVGLNTGCGPVFATKAWTAAGFADLIARLASDPEGPSVLLLGGPRERELNAEIAQAVSGKAGVGGRLFDAGTDNDLETFFALIERCAAVVSADSLAMHVAVALRVPVVAFFGPTSAQEIDLFGRGEKIVTDYACAPCYLKSCNVKPRCLTVMEAAEVEAALRRVMAGVG
ncbi:MAG: glycosyltransferase family 9 protein [Sumerlaeia bacterium]